MNFQSKLIVFLIACNIITLTVCYSFKKMNDKLTDSVTISSNEILNLKKVRDSELQKIKDAYELEIEKNQLALKLEESKKIELQKKYDSLKESFLKENKKKVEKKVIDSSMQEIAEGILKGIDDYEKFND